VVKEPARARGLIGVQPAEVDRADVGRVNLPVLLVDQPPGGLVAGDQAEQRDRLVRLRATHRVTIVMALDTLDEATALCDQVALLDHGRLVAIDSPWAILGGMDEVIVDFLPSGDPRRALQELHDHGVPIRHAFQLEARLAVPATRSQAEDLTALIHREHLSAARVTTRPPTIDDVCVQLRSECADAVAA
jgi:ABC-2 type transport system ATP-binding protein